MIHRSIIHVIHRTMTWCWIIPACAERRPCGRVDGSGCARAWCWIIPACAERRPCGRVDGSGCARAWCWIIPACAERRPCGRVDGSGCARAWCWIIPACAERRPCGRVDGSGCARAWCWIIPACAERRPGSIGQPCRAPRNAAARPFVLLRPPAFWPAHRFHDLQAALGLGTVTLSFWRSNFGRAARNLRSR